MARWQIWRKISTYIKATIDNNNMRPFGRSQLVTPPRDLAWVKQPHGIQTMALGIKYGKEYGVSAKATNDDNITQFVAIWPKPSGDTAT